MKKGFNTLYEQRAQTINTLTSMIKYSRTQPMSLQLLRRVFQCLQQLLSQAPQLSMIQSHIQSCLKQIVLKLVVFYQSNNIQQKLVVNLCWNNIKTIVDRSFMTNSKGLLKSVEQIIMPLYQYILIPDIDEQQFIYCLGKFIQSSQKITKDYQINFFKHIPHFLQKNKYRLFDLFEIINIYIAYQPKLFIDNIQNIEMVITMVLKVFEAENNKQDQICQATIILQNLIYNFHQSFKQEHWTVIIETVFKKLQSNIVNSFLYSNLIVVLGLCFLSNFDVLQNTPIGAKILEQMMKISYFIDDYPRKVHIVCLCDLLKKIHSNLIKSYYLQLFDFAITLTRTSHCKNQSQIDQEQQQKVAFNSQHTSYNMIQERYQSKMKLLDEFQIMKKTLRQVKNSHPQEFNQIVKQLPNEKKQYLKVVMQIQKVGSNQYRSIIKVKRDQ